MNNKLLSVLDNIAIIGGHKPEDFYCCQENIMKTLQMKFFDHYYNIHLLLEKNAIRKLERVPGEPVANSNCKFL